MKKIYILLIFIITALFGISQTGPGGVGNSSTNVLWLDASQLTLNNNDPVSSWNDVSGNGNNAIQSNATNQPTYLSTGFNGHPAVLFDGVNDYFDLTNHISAPAQSVFAVNQFGTPNGWTFLYMADQCDLMSNNGYNFGYYANGTFVSAGPYTAGNQKIISILVDNAAGTLQTGRDNTYSLHTYPGVVSKSQSTIGANYYGGAYNQFHSGIVPEIIVYNYRVNNAQKIIINNYLAAKYGLTIYNDFYTFDITHPYEVAGIGSWGGSTHTQSQGTSNIEISNPSQLNPGNFLFWGHDGKDYSINYDMPASLNGGRWNRTWRIDNKNLTGTYDVRIYIGTHPIGTDNTQYYLIYDTDDGVFSNGGGNSIGPGVYDAISNSVLFAGVSIPDHAWFTLGNLSGSVVSIGSGNWNNPATWSCNCVPDSTVNVTIKNTHNVTVDMYSSINSITIESGATLTLGATNTLSIKGNLTNNGTFTSNQGTLKFSGTNNQYITNNNSSIINLDVYNYRQTNTNSVYLTKGNLRILNNLYINGYLKNIGPNYIVLLSDATNTSYISPTSVTSPFSGNFRIIRSISSRNAAWADIASATSQGTFGHLDNKLYFSGIGGGDGNAGSNGNIFYSAYAYNATTQQYDTVKTTSRTLNAGEGFEIWLATDPTTYAGGIYYVNGIPNTGNINASAYLPANSGEWALLGNPYMSWIDWSVVNRTNLDNTIWIYDAATANYKSYSNPQIPPMQGFWVQATGNSPTLTFIEAAKVANNSSTFYRVKTQEQFAITLKENATGYAQTTAINIEPNASLGYEAGKDVTLLKSPNPDALSFTTLSTEGKKLMVSAIPQDNELTIPLFLDIKTPGIYSMQAEGLNLVSEYQTIVIKDAVTKQVYDLKSGVFELFLNKGTYNNRFSLHMSTSFEREINNSHPIVYWNNNQLVIKLNNHSKTSSNGTNTIVIYAINGQELASYTLPYGQHNLPVNIAKGAYLVKIIDGEGNVSVQKLIIP